MEAMQNTHALVIGIANYQSVRKLPETVLKDAGDIGALLVDPSYCGYPADHVKLLLDGEATRDNIRAALKALAQGSDQDSTVFFYISSHGGRIESGAHAGEYLLPVDAVYSSAESIAQTAISDDEFSQALSAIPAGKVLVVFDCCHSGGIGYIKDATVPEIKALPASYYEKLQEGKGRVILASSDSTEYSYVIPGDANSLFTKHLLAGLRGGIASDDGLIRIFDLYEYLQPAISREQPKQHPLFISRIRENFPVALRVGGQKSPVLVDDEGFRFDAYISYVDKPPDSDRVWDILMPRLEDAGVRVAVSGDVAEPGVDRVVGVERGIQQAKRTIVVLSDAYLADHMAEFENTVGQTMGIQEGTYRLLPVKFGDVDESHIPVRLSMLTTLNLAHPRRAEREFERLVRALQEPLPRR
jgi:hypothetical protein